MMGNQSTGGELRRPLLHVYWIGGSPCSGKSSIVERLSERHAFQSYRVDDAFGAHTARATADAQPHLYRVARINWDEIWGRPVEILLQDEIAVYREEWAMIVDDLLALPDDLPVIAEGAALLPKLVHRVLSERRHAIWIVPTEAFQRQTYAQRGAWVDEILSHCTQPEQAFESWMARDTAYARWVQREARRLGLEARIVDGRRSIDENAAIVEAHFGLDAKEEKA
jgi:hypothetical protein